MAKNTCHHSIFTMFTMSLAALLLWCSSLTVSCRPTTQNTNMAEVKTDGGYQSSFEELPGYFVELMNKPAKPENLNYPETVDKNSFQPSPASSDRRQDIHDTEAYKSFCTGTHIGSGFILTAAHCITDFVCGDSKMTELSRIGLKYNRKTRGGAQQAFQNISAIKAVVFHHGFYELQAGIPAPVMQLRNDLALIKTSGLDFADTARLPELSEHHLSAAQLSGKNLLVYGTGRSYAAQLMRQRLNTLGKDYFWGKVTATNFKLQRFIDLEIDRLVHTTPIEVERLTSFLESLNLSHQPTPLSCTNNYAYPPTLQHEVRTPIIPQGKLKSSALKELSKPITDRSRQILQPLGEYIATERAREYGLHPASSNPPIVVTEVMPDHIPGRIRALCGGDSGGPLMDQQSQTIVGVVSTFIDNYSPELEGLHDPRCGDPIYLLFPSTYHHLNWIKAAKASILNGHHQLPTYNQTSSSSTLQDNDLDP